MKIKNLIFIAIAALTFGVTAQAASVALFVRGGAEYTQFKSTGNFDYFPDWEVGAVVGGGVVLGGVHSIGIEVSYAESRSIVSSSPVFKTKKMQMPILVGYNYTHAFSDVFSVYGGITAGMMMDKYSLDTTNVESSGTATNWIPAAGVVAGVNLSLGGGWYLNGGARVLGVRQKVYKSIAGFADIGKDTTYTRPTFTLGLGYKW